MASNAAPHWSAELALAANPANPPEGQQTLAVSWPANPPPPSEPNIPGVNQGQGTPIVRWESKSMPKEQKSAPQQNAPDLDLPPNQLFLACSAPTKAIESRNSKPDARARRTSEREREVDQELRDMMDDSSMDLDTLEDLELKMKAVIGDSLELHHEPSTGDSSRAKRRYQSVLGSRVFKDILGEMGLGDHTRGRGKPYVELSSHYSGELLNTHLCSQPGDSQNDEALPWAAERQRQRRKLRQRGLKRAYEGTSSLKSRRKKQKQEMLSDGPTKSRRFFAGNNLARTDQQKQDTYDQIKTLGRGGQGTAHLLKSRTTGALLVCKVIYKEIKHHQDHFAYKRGDELFFLRNALLPNPRIINLHSALTSSTQIQLYLEYCDGGDLSSLIRKFHHRYNHETREWDYYRIPECFIWHVFLQLAEALAYIHHGRDHRDSSTQPSNKDWLSVVHRDIKPHNILLRRNAASANPAHAAAHNEEPYPNVILADFGMAIRARLPGSEPTSDQHCGTERFQPPEKPLHSQKGDVYSLGATICKLLTGDLPEEPDLPNNINASDDDDEGFENWEAALVRMEEESAPRGFEEPWPYSRELVRWVARCVEFEHKDRKKKKEKEKEGEAIALVGGGGGGAAVVIVVENEGLWADGTFGDHGHGGDEAELFVDAGAEVGVGEGGEGGWVGPFLRILLGLGGEYGVKGGLQAALSGKVEGEEDEEEG
ncbi:MAG: hypothetical protein Q9212_003239 [Teloschistes hypoglaucus]